MTPKIVCVAGPTACGKTTLGVLLARRFHGEVVSADSMQRTVERRGIRGEGHAHRG